MAEQYDMHSTSAQSAVIDERILSATQTTRLVLLPQIVRNRRHAEAKVKVTLLHQRKSPLATWENEPSAALSALKAGESKKLILDSEQTLNLKKELNNLYAIGDKVGVNRGNAELIVAPAAEVIVTDRNKASIINSLLAEGYSDDVWRALVQNDPDLATRLSYAQIHTERSAALQLFAANLALNQPESWWKDFFERNKWIFGYGLNYQILKPTQTQPHYGGTRVSGRGTQKGDFLQRTEAETKFTVLVEIKRPNTLVLGHQQYRNGAHELGSQLTGGVTQLQANCRTWEIEGSQSEDNREALLKQKIFTVQPKGILVIGHTNQLDKISKRNTFELFRRNIINPEIITYDELFERAKFIVESTKENGDGVTQTSSEDVVTDDEIPF